MAEETSLTIHMDEKRKKALALMLRGRTDTSIAEEVKVSRMTLYRWRKDDLVFTRALEERRLMMREQAEEGLLELTELAI